MLNNYDEQIDLICKANDYYSYIRILNKYPELTQLSNMDILEHICEFFENSIKQSIDICGRIHYEYVVYGLIPMYEQFGESQVLAKCLTQLEISESLNYDCDLLRDIYVAKAKVYMYLNQFSLAEEYITNAYNDYDYRTNTFALLMQILDSQNKFELMLKYLQDYCGKFSNLHQKINCERLQLKNINSSKYIDQFKMVLED